MTKLCGYDRAPAQVTEGNALGYDEYRQVCAVYVSGREENTAEVGLKQLEKYEELTRKSGRIKYLLSVENADAMGKNTCNFDRFLESGLRMLSLTHNRDNEYACGCSTSYDAGLTQRGRQMVKLAERNGVVIDISHLSFNSAYDVLRCAERPVCASHSNAYGVCAHRRNITDDMFAQIVRTGGVVGINMYPDFLGSEADSDGVMRHILHFIKLGGKKNIAFGCDFDGIEKTPFDIKNPSYLKILYKKAENYDIDLKTMDDIYYNNAYDYIYNLT